MERMGVKSASVGMRVGIVCQLVSFFFVCFLFVFCLVESLGCDCLRWKSCDYKVVYCGWMRCDE